MLDMIIIDGLSFSLPLFIMAIGGIYSEKSGITNLALEGMQGFGAFFGALAAVLLMQNMDPTSQVPYYVSFIAAVIGGMLFSFVHIILCIKFKANQVISGVVVNIVVATDIKACRQAQVVDGLIASEPRFVADNP